MILLEHKEAVAAWVQERVRTPEMQGFDDRWYEALGFLDAHERLCGGVVYYNWTGHDIEAMAAGVGYWLTPLKVRAIFLYPFEQLGCRRMTAKASRTNKRSRRFVERLGFKLEGKMRKGMADGRDLMIYGMLKQECHWIADARRSRTQACGPAVAGDAATVSGQPRHA